MVVWCARNICPGQKLSLLSSLIVVQLTHEFPRFGWPSLPPSPVYFFFFRAFFSVLRTHSGPPSSQEELSCCAAIKREVSLTPGLLFGKNYSKCDFDDCYFFPVGEGVNKRFLRPESMHFLGRGCAHCCDVYYVP